ncbi:nuclear transcription factor Y subunit B-5 [Cucumis sativus]|uniref:Transcription factor CBF/NF-Y/archaeal histone domain-containing protein n=1 Tax=Cucumis sativus TaxID=3659 RepID=A0A0A0K954_CUCSA|nr:nuclear transcription factor Y subunit B-5 [Cucumis sativus]
MDENTGMPERSIEFKYDFTGGGSSGVGGSTGGSSEEAGNGVGGVVKEQDRLLPIANVGRIMKQILPPNAKISKEAKETMQECVSEFISFVTGEASDKCHKEKRKTVNGDDICCALATLGFDDYAEPLRRYLVRYRDMEGERAQQNKGCCNNSNNNNNNDG